MPANRVAELTLRSAPTPCAGRRDAAAPREVTEAGSAIAASALEDDALAGFLGAQPANYNYHNSLTNDAPLHAAGSIGANVVVALIDSGTASAATSIAGTVIGGENFVPAVQDPVASATSRLNDFHGTATANMIAAHANFLFASTSALARSVRTHAPASIFDCPNAAFPGCPAGASVIPMFGTAPGAKVYAMKVFPSRGGGAPESRIIAAMNRAITLRRNFNKGASTDPVSGTGPRTTRLSTTR